MRRITAAIALLLLTSPVALAQSKQARYARMIELARQMDALRPSLASHPANAWAWSQRMDEYRRLSQSLGGDDPAAAIAMGSRPPAAPSAPKAVPQAPPGCLSVENNFANDVDVPIPTGPAVVTSQIVVADQGPFLWDLDVRTTIAHTFAGDLDITLTSPSGRVATLTTDNGGPNTNVFRGTTWDDQANPGGQVPYSTNIGLVTDHLYANGSLANPLSPEEPLSAFRGEDPNGTWTLTISDDLADDGGLLEEWTLFLAVLPSAPAGNGWALPNAPGATIPPGPAVVTSTFDINFPLFLCGMGAIVSVNHTVPADLDMTLMSPAGTIATLTTDNGGGNNNVFGGTFWGDDYDPDGQVPYTTNDGLVTDHLYFESVVVGNLVPEEGFGVFSGEDAQGTWTLTISDDTAGEGGELLGWTLSPRACNGIQTASPRRVDMHPGTGVSNVNGVAEPGEQFLYESSLRNAGAAFGESFDGVYVPALPGGWNSTLLSVQPGDSPWRTVGNATPPAPPNAAFAPSPDHVTDSYLETPSLAVNDTNRILELRHRFNLQDGFDGAVVEVSVDGGPFVDVLTAGAGFFGGGYTDTIAGGTQSPIVGRQAFSGDSGGFQVSILILPVSMIGHDAVFRFRAATDNSQASGGWWIDTIALGGLAPADVTADVFFFVGPAGATYTRVDNTADFGTIFSGTANNCYDATGDCFEFAVSNPAVRPAVHWDLRLIERTAGLALFAPGNPSGLPIHIGKSFDDVSQASGFYRFIETLLHHQVTSGCGPTSYCPGSNVLREQMAVFLLVAKNGSGYSPPDCTMPSFSDVPCASPYAKWINQLAALGITGGCGGGNFCPISPVLREQMAVFLLTTLEGTGYAPAPCTTPIFGDVPCASIYSKWINELARRGITGGCGGGNYCPAQAVTREQMAVFLSVTFTLHLY